MVYEESKKITKLYLYGEDAIPSDFLDTGLLRENPLNTPPEYHVNKQTFMTTGGGRFAVGAQFELIQKFATQTIGVGTYSKAQIAAIVGLSRYDWEMEQYNYKDGQSMQEYAERVYIYNTMSFQISDEAVFVVEANGTKKIQNFYIEPRKNVQENFDFESSSLLGILGNPSLEAKIDPSAIGRTVNIEFDGAMTSKTYMVNGANNHFDADKALINTWITESNIVTAGLLAQLPSLMSELTEELWDSGITKFMTEEGKPIIYGTVGNRPLSKLIFQDRRRIR